MPNRAFTATTSPLPAVSYEPRRQALVVYNNGTDTVFVSENAGSPSTDGVPVPPQVGFVVHGRAATVAFWVQANSGSQALRIYEGFGADERAAVASLAGTATSRPQWYDRAPIASAIAYSASVGPHGGTVRASYTVPTAKKALIEAIFTQMYRDGAAAPAAEAVASVRYTDSGGTVRILQRLADNIAGVATISAQVIAGATLLGVAGDVFDLATSDGSTGGTHQFVMTIKYTEFSA